MPKHIQTFGSQSGPNQFALCSRVGDVSGSDITFTHGQAVSFAIPVSGPHVAPLTWTQTSGELPPGVSFSDGIISGTPSAVGTAEPVTFMAVDSSSPNQFACAAFTVTVS